MRIMQRIFLRLLFSTAIAASALATTAASRQTCNARPANHVVIITLDGFGGWALDDPQLPLPTLRKLAAGGAVAKGMRPVNPTVTWPNHTSIVTGVTPARHGVLFNGSLIRQPGVVPRVEPWVDKKRDGEESDALRPRARARDDDRAGGLGRDLQRADHHVGISRASARKGRR